MMTNDDAVLKTLDKPRSTYGILRIVDPSGSTDALQILLMRLRDEGKVKFNITKGVWSRV